MSKLIVNTMEALKGFSSPPASPKTPLTKSPSNKRFNFRKSLQKRSSKLLGKDKASNPQAYTDEMIRLETLLMSQKGRQVLVQDLLSVPGNLSVKVRFISAVDTYDSGETREDRARLGEKIVDTFLQKGSLFYISLNDERINAILAGNYDQLLFARKDVLEELASHEEVMNFVDERETMDGLL